MSYGLFILVLPSYAKYRIALMHANRRTWPVLPSFPSRALDVALRLEKLRRGQDTQSVPWRAQRCPACL